MLITKVLIVGRVLITKVLIVVKVLITKVLIVGKVLITKILIVKVLNSKSINSNTDYYIHGCRTQKYGKTMSRLILEMSITSEIINRF